MGRTDRQTDGQDPYCGLLGRPHKIQTINDNISVITHVYCATCCIKASIRRHCNQHPHSRCRAVNAYSRVGVLPKLLFPLSLDITRNNAVVLAECDRLRHR